MAEVAPHKVIPYKEDILQPYRLLAVAGAVAGAKGLILVNGAFRDAMGNDFGSPVCSEVTERVFLVGLGAIALSAVLFVSYYKIRTGRLKNRMAWLGNHTQLNGKGE